MEVFISWSKNKSRLLALATKGFIQNVFGKKLKYFSHRICIKELPSITRYIVIF